MGRVMQKWSEADIPSQKGRLTIVTGGNSGLGWFTALGLARAGANVVVATRSEQKARESMEKIRSIVPGASVRFESLDLASLASVRNFAERMDRLPKVDTLVNNAGVMFVPKRQLTEDGFERQFGTNYLGPFALTMGLLPTLLRSSSPRVTTVTSSSANGGKKRIMFEDLQWDHSYAHYHAYCQSKLADLMFALELARRSEAAGLPLISNACHPGVARTNLQSSGRGRPPSAGFRFILHFIAQDAEDGALSILRAATDPTAPSGSYYGPARGMKGDPVPCTVYPPALELEARTKLWEISENLTGAHWSFGLPDHQTLKIPRMATA
jgi:NAD(P)-dependent dehydrogenase (short-subunit alcohol dehydrogenase family)